MLMKENSFWFRALLFICSPTQRLPSLIPLWVESARVGTNTTDYVNVWFGNRPPRQR